MLAVTEMSRPRFAPLDMTEGWMGPSISFLFFGIAAPPGNRHTTRSSDCVHRFRTPNTSLSLSERFCR